MRSSIFIVTIFFSASIYGAFSDKITLIIKNDTPVGAGIHMIGFKKSAQTNLTNTTVRARAQKTVPVKSPSDAYDRISLRVTFDPPLEVPSLNYLFSGEDFNEINGKTMRLAIRADDPAFQKYEPKPEESKKFAEKR